MCSCGPLVLLLLDRKIKIIHIVVQFNTMEMVMGALCTGLCFNNCIVLGFVRKKKVTKIVADYEERGDKMTEDMTWTAERKQLEWQWDPAKLNSPLKSQLFFQKYELIIYSNQICTLMSCSYSFTHQGQI